ncbi:MAG: hypothetical protein J6Y03_00935 [Alphaproteobacteria bacterium]|nr:hypothetical protein [Alphaproteobacteria bacterium]
MDGIIALSILLAPVIFYVIYYCRHSDKSVYKKNLFDWIVYILAWLAIPFFIVSAFAFVHRPLTYDFVHRSHVVKCKNWEELRRLNLYMVVLLCVIGAIVGPFIYLCQHLKSIGYISDNPNDLVAYFFIFLICFIVIFFLCFTWKLMEKYEKYIESKSYIPETQKPISIKKSKKEKANAPFRKSHFNHKRK